MDLKKINNNGKLKIPSTPLMFFQDLTEKCNLNCWFCYNDIKHTTNHAKYENIIKIIDIMYKSGCNEVTYIGGEPSLHPNLLEILHYAEKLGMIQNIISNGQIINIEFAKKISDIKNLCIGISIHSCREEIQNNISRNKKSFTKIERAIDSLNYYNIPWYSQTSLINSNYKEIKKIWEYLVLKGNKIRMDLSRMVVKNIYSDKFLDEKEYIDVFGQINSIDLDILPIRIEAFPRCWIKKICKDYGYKYDKIKKSVRPCYAWIAQISVDIYGNIRLCPTGGEIAGNILKDGIEKIWKNNITIQNFQNFHWQRKECLDCEDFIFCVGACKMTCNHQSPTPDNYIIKGGMNNACIN